MKYDLTNSGHEVNGFYEWNKNNFLIKSNDERAKDYSQFKKENGFSPDETWSLYTSICLFILPRLKHFRDNIHGYPTCFQTIDEWEKILDKMINAFDLLLNADDKKQEKFYKTINEGLDLFSKYFCDLWD